MKTFLINLDKNPERLEASKRQLDALDVKFERIAAVYGKALSPQEKRKSVNRFRWWCTRGYDIRDGEIGCALSHKIIYERMLQENIPIACVLEDDNCYRNTFKQVAQELEGLMVAKRPQVVLLSNCTPERASSESVQILPSKGDQWTSSYLITLSAARAILKANYPIQVPSDGWGRWVKRGLIELYHGFPTIADQDGHPLFAYGIPLSALSDRDSDIEGSATFRVDALPLHWKVIHKLKRAIGLTLDRCIPLKEAR